jgi:hypothetical protein
MGDLGQHTRSIAGLAVGVNTAPMFHTADSLEGHLHDIVPDSTGGAGNKANTTGVVFKFGPVEGVVEVLHKVLTDYNKKIVNDE